MIVAYVIFAVIGLIAGFLGGLLGIGGGLVTVPGLSWAFEFLGLQSEHTMKVAIGTSLGAMVFTGGVSAINHILKKGVVWKLYFSLAPGILVGAASIAIVAQFLPNLLMRYIFAGFEILFGIYFFFFRKKTPEGEGEMKIPHLFAMLAIGFGIGGLSTFLGIGGGLVTVPILNAFGVPMKNSIATSAATGFFIAIVGAISFLMLGLHVQIMPGAIGYLYVPAFITIGLASLIVVPLGVRLTYKFNATTLRRIFGVFLIIAGLSMLFH